MIKIAITTVPFAKSSSQPLSILFNHGFAVSHNQTGKLDKLAMAEFIGEANGAIVGTEDLSEVIKSCPNLKIIAKTGIGLDNIDFAALKKRNITLTYTPDAPTYAVSELTVSMMINLSRKLFLANDLMKQGKWERYIGLDLSESTVGIIGFGRVGKMVCRMLSGFGVPKILVNDVREISDEISTYQQQFALNIEIATKNEIYNHANIISIHIPATPSTNNLLNKEVFATMKPTACLVNTSRGPVVDEEALYEFLSRNDGASAGLDVFKIEPYLDGKLSTLKNAFLTCHMGSCSNSARLAMELQASQSIIDFFNDQIPKNLASQDNLC